MSGGPAFPPTSRALELAGPAGPLEALQEEPTGESVGAGVVCHPHPLHGGTMHNKVVYRAAKGLVAAGFTALRFNFRGVGRSAGTHDAGQGEQADVTAALEHLGASSGGRPLLAAGFSFGSVMALRAAQLHPGVVALAGIGLPLTHTRLDFLQPLRLPLLILHGSDDPFGEAAEVRRLAATLGPRVRLEIISGAGHFFDGHLDTVTAIMRDFCLSVAGQWPHA